VVRDIQSDVLLIRAEVPEYRIRVETKKSEGKISKLVGGVSRQSVWMEIVSTGRHKRLGVGSKPSI